MKKIVTLYGSFLLGIILNLLLGNSLVFADSGYYLKETENPLGISLIEDAVINDYYLAPSDIKYNVKDFGAKGDGLHKDTHSINQAIEAASENGGGIVYFPAGIYLSGSIELRNHITLFLGPGSVIQASTDAVDYNKPEDQSYELFQDFGHSHWENSLIWGINLHHVTIEGSGTIDGKGLVTGTPKGKEEGLGDKAIALKNCYKVILRDFSIYRGGHFGVLATGVDNLTIDNLTIDTDRDGINVDACNHTTISNCRINSPWNDAICPKSSMALGYPKPTENLLITNCFVTGGYQLGTFLDASYVPITKEEREFPTGRIKLGTESNGGFKNITISNCVFEHSRGFVLGAVDGGDLEDIAISNITMRDIIGPPIYMRLGSRLRGPKGTQVGHLRRIQINNLVAYNASCSTEKIGTLITGVPGHTIEDISLSNIRIVYKGGGTKEDATLNPPEKEDTYPEIFKFGTLPSYGFYIRHAKGVRLNNISLDYIESDERPAIVLKDVEDAQFRYVEAKTKGSKNFIHLIDARNIFLNYSGGYQDLNIKNERNRKL